MNRKKREIVQNIVAKLDECYDRLNDVYEDESEARDNIPENLQGTERYEAMDHACDVLDDAMSALREDVIVPLQEME